jgi:hypothetical protein
MIVGWSESTGSNPAGSAGFAASALEAPGATTEQRGAMWFHSERVADVSSNLST